MQCKDCSHLRSDIECISPKTVITSVYGERQNPCNRYPQNIYRHRLEPACGEFKPRPRLN